MQVNICPRLIQKMISNGVRFLDNFNHPNESVSFPFGLYAAKTYKTGDIVCVMCGQLLTCPSQQSIHIGNNMHLEDDYGQYVNHSFEPNIRVENNKLIAIKDINIYDELTFNYNETEIDMECPFEDDGILVCGKKSK